MPTSPASSIAVHVTISEAMLAVSLTGTAVAGCEVVLAGTESLVVVVAGTDSATDAFSAEGVGVGVVGFGSAAAATGAGAGVEVD